MLQALIQSRLQFTVAGLLNFSEVDNQILPLGLYGAVCAGNSTGQTALERRAFLEATYRTVLAVPACCHLPCPIPSIDSRTHSPFSAAPG